MTRRNCLADIEHQNRESERRIRVYEAESQLKSLIQNLDAPNRITKAQISAKLEQILFALTGEEL